MIRRVLSLSRLPLFFTVVALVALFSFTGRRELVVHVYLLVLAAYALGTLVAEIRRRNPVAARSTLDLALRSRRPRREQLPDLERVGRELALASQTAADLHFRLRPRLRRIATQLLAARRGIELDANPAAARSALGEELWEIVRADRETPTRRHAKGLDPAKADRIVAALERL